MKEHVAAITAFIPSLIHTQQTVPNSEGLEEHERRLTAPTVTRIVNRLNLADKKVMV